MQAVKGRVLNAPEILYRNMAKQTVRNGAWQMENSMNLFKTPELKNWVVVWLANKDTRKFRRTPINDVKDKLFAHIQTAFNSRGLINAEPAWIDAERMNESEAFSEVRKKCVKPQICVFVINDGSQYETIKHLAERDEFGFVTQCINLVKLGQFIDDDYKLQNYLSNILLKVNAKLGGVNNKTTYDKLKK